MIDAVRLQHPFDQLAMLPGEDYPAARPGRRASALMTGAILIASGRMPIVQTIVFIGWASFRRASTIAATHYALTGPVAGPARAISA